MTADRLANLACVGRPGLCRLPPRAVTGIWPAACLAKRKVCLSWAGKHAFHRASFDCWERRRTGDSAARNQKASATIEAYCIIDCIIES
jgi:hypothetical protein